MPTKKEDWTVTVTSRVDADYSDRIERISFSVRYKNGEPEQLFDVPFPKGTTLDDLVEWCAVDTIEAEPLRAPEQQQPVVYGGWRRIREMAIDHGVYPYKS